MRFLTALPVIALSATTHAQLISSWIAPSVDDGTQTHSLVGTWHTDTATGEITDLEGVFKSRALAADNVRGRLYGSGGGNLATFVLDDQGNFVSAGSVTIRDAGGVAALTNQVESMGFANGVIYASVTRSAGDERRRRGIPKGFYAINPETGVATLIPAASGLPLLRGMDYNPADGLLYGVVGNNNAQSIVSISLTTFAMTTVATVPASAYGNEGFGFDGVAVGEGKVFLTNGLWITNIPVVVFNIATGTFEQGLPSPRRSTENRSYPNGATYFAPEAP